MIVYWPRSADSHPRLHQLLEKSKNTRSTRRKSREENTTLTLAATATITASDQAQPLVAAAMILATINTTAVPRPDHRVITTALITAVVVVDQKIRVNTALAILCVSCQLITTMTERSRLNVQYHW